MQHETQITAEMLRQAYRQTQREILALTQPHATRWERMAELLNERLASFASASAKPDRDTLR